MLEAFDDGPLPIPGPPLETGIGQPLDNGGDRRADRLELALEIQQGRVHALIVWRG